MIPFSIELRNSQRPHNTTSIAISAIALGGAVIVGMFGSHFLNWQAIGLVFILPLVAGLLTLFSTPVMPAFFFMGGLFALNQSGVTPIKLVWFGLLGFAIIIAFSSNKVHRIRVATGMQTLFAPAALLALALAASMLVAGFNQVSIANMVPGVTAYGLLLIAPFVGLLLGTFYSFKQCERLLLALAIACCISLSSNWLADRQLAAIPALPVFPSGTIVLIAMVYSALRAMSTRSLAWAFLLMLFFGSIVLTASRALLVSSLLLLIAIILTARGSHVAVTYGYRLRFTALAGMALAIPIGLLIYVDKTIASGIFDRYKSLIDLNRLVYNDSSATGRILFGKFAMAEFLQRPLTGWGFGGFHDRWAQWLAATGAKASSGLFLPPFYIPDTPLHVLPTLGLLGTIVLFWFMYKSVSYLRSSRHTLDSAFIASTSNWLIVYALLLSPLSLIIDEKAFGIGFACLFGLKISSLVSPAGYSPGTHQ